MSNILAGDSAFIRAKKDKEAASKYKEDLTKKKAIRINKNTIIFK